MRALLDFEQVPEEVSAFLGEISAEDYRAAIFVTLCILNALEWTSYDDRKPVEYDLAQKERLMRSVFGSLASFRATGEP